VAERINRILQAEELPQERQRAGRKTKAYDLRPLIERLELEQPGPVDRTVTLGMQLAARQGATARPEAVLAAMGLDGVFARYHRRRLVLE
jgi:hypothetical protein